jgi:hypothetical protein
MFRNGCDNNIRSADAIPVLENGSNARTAEASGAATVTVPFFWHRYARKMPLIRNWRKPGSITTPHVANPTAPGFATARILNQIITYDAYNMAEVFLTQPLQIVAGECGGKQMDERRFV